MAAPVKLTKAEGIALVAALEKRVGYDALAFALVGAIGAERAGKLIAEKQGRISKAETVALVKAIVPLIPGTTLKAKVKVAISALREAIPDRERQDAILAYVIERIKAYKNPPPVSDPSAIPPWDACTRASCWNGSNAQQRMMNVLSPGMSAAKYAQYRDWMLSIGCNTSHVFLSNRRDGEGAGYSIYKGEWSWEIDPANVKLFSDRIADLRAHGLAVVVWLLADDSSAWNKEAAKNFPRYLADLEAQGLLAEASTVVAGLELDEYYQSAQVSALINAIRKVYPGKVGTHQTSGRYEFAALADICFYQVSPGKSAAQIKADAAKVCKATGKPVNFFELDRQPNRALCDAAFAGGAFAVGNWRGEAEAQPGQTDGAILPSQVKWFGMDYSKAKTTVVLSNVKMLGNHLDFTATPAPPWPPYGAKKCRAVGFLIRKIGWKYIGGKVEWCVVERGWYDIKTNVLDGYNGSTVPADGETCWAGLGHTTNGSEVSTLVPFVWKA